MFVEGFQGEVDLASAVAALFASAVLFALMWLVSEDGQ